MAIPRGGNNVDAYHSFLDTFPDIGSDPEMRGYELMLLVDEWAEAWPEDVWIEGVDDALFTCSSLVFIRTDCGPRGMGHHLALITIPQNMNMPTVLHITQPMRIIEILTKILEE